MKKSNLFRCVIIFCFLFFVKNSYAQNLTATVIYIPCGEVELTIDGGTAPYTIDWGDGVTQVTSNNVVYYFYGFDGTFLITITDAQNEIFELTVDVFSCFIDIIGDPEACVGDCSTFISTGGQNSVEWHVIDANGNSIFQSQGFDLIYCWDTVGEYTIIVTDYFSGAANELPVNVMLGSTPIDIVSLANTFCQADSLNPSSCDKICANSTAIYTILGGQNVTWEVLGADNFTPNGNQVTVEWGAPGSGQVTATASTGGNSSSDLEVDCNSIFFNGIAGFLFGGEVQVTGGIPPYTASWMGPNGVILSSAFDFAINNVSNNDVGTYTVFVTDASGAVEECSVFFSSSQLGCFQASDFDIIEPSDCNDCDGEITVNVYELNSTDYFYQWSNGSTVGPTLTGVCSGFYAVTVTNFFGCDIVQSIEIGCDSTSFSSCPSTTSLCIDILEDPDAKFTTIPAATNGVVNICEGGTVVFNNESEGATLFEWNFGNGNVSTSTNAEQTYPNAGTYTAYLISRNDCYCSDTTFVTIEVADAISPFLDCVGTICENTTSTYTTSADCGTFNWTVTGDYTIVDGGGTGDDFITIEWLSGPEGIIELGVSGCTGGNYCLAPVVEVVPIISDDATIKGPEKVCRLDEATYFIDDYSATDFVWTVSNGGNILEGQNTSTIKVRWDGPVSPNAQQFVSVDYDNCYLGCGGSDTKDVYILPELYLGGAIEVCENGMSMHEAKKNVSFGTNTVNCNWTVTNGSGTAVWTSATPSSQINLDWSTISTGSGRYAILAIPANPLEVCNNDFTSYINVVEPPAAPVSIDGITQICVGEFYTYTVNTPNPDYVFNWTINDGGVISTQTGNAINVSFGSTPPYILSVTQTSTDGLACESDAVDLAIFPIPNFSITGDDEVCEEKEGIYTADLFEGVIYDWKILPADAGTIIAGQNSNSIEVFWHTDGAANVEVTMCNMIENFPVTVIAKPEPLTTGNLFVCPNEATMLGTVDVYDTYVWKTESGNVITNTPTVLLPAGAYELIVTNSFGCENNISFEVVGFSEPSVNVSVFGSRGRCYTGLNPDAPAELQATEIPAGYTYEWFFNNTPIPNSNSSVITSSNFGSFHVVVSDQYGCEISSNSITIFELCNHSGGGVCNNPGLPGSPCIQGTDLQMTFSPTNDCNVFDFQSIMPNVAFTSVSWDFDDLASGGNNTSTSFNPSHEFSSPGHFIVTLTGVNASGSVCWDSKLVSVPIVPNFNFSTACEGDAMMFEDLTEFLPNETVQGWSWNFGDPASGANNTSTNQNPFHTYATTGTYVVVLTASHASGCTSTISKTVTVETPPTIDFDEPTLNCQATALEFIPQPSADVLFYDWNFGDPASGDANTSEIASPFHAYENAGNYSVTCTVTDIWGCSSNTTKMITVEPNSLSGNISFSTPSPICDGDVTTLTAPAGGVSWEWSDGSITESITTGEAGAYIVTVTNNIGCKYITPTAVLDVIALPTATIQAVEYDEFGQPINSFYDNYATCEGEDVFLQVVENTSYSYTWSDGTIGNVLEYSDDRDNLLTAGTYSISLDILDNTTGCSNTVGPFEIVIHPTPVDIQISSSPATPICENNLTTLSVDNPSVDLTYVWNTGEMGISIQVSAGGEYFVRGITQFGCSDESNKLEILSGPDLKKIPDGCHTRCKPDTICLPTINGVASYQWYLDGTAISGPSGTVGDLIALESGNYHVVMTDIYGCETTSDILSLDLFDGFGTFEGNVYMDVNENGIIDAADTLVNGIDIILTENGLPLDTVISGMNGEYNFTNILSTTYNLSVDESTLPLGVTPVWNNLDSTLVGCDDLENVDWLLQFDCINSITDLSEETCFGVDYIFDATIVPLGAPMTFTYVDVLGCDSIINVTVTELPDYNTLTSLNACDGNDIVYNGLTLIAGSTTEFPMVSPEGCDYIETVEVIPFPTNSMVENFEICQGENINYNGQQLSAGMQMDVTFQNQFGCDSIVTVTVAAFPEIQFDLQTNEPCWNATEGIISISNPSGTAPLEFSLDGNNYQTDLVFENIFPTNYMLQVRDANGCEMEEEINFITQPQLIVQVPTPFLPCDGSEVTLAPQVVSGDNSNLIYEWSDGSDETELTVNQDGTYLVSISNDCETVTEEVQVMYEDQARGIYFYIPNAFSPNGDGYNDFFKTYPSPDVQVLTYDLYIYDRWGNQLYDTHNVDNGWNGRMNNKKFNPGVFVYYIRANITSCGRTFEVFRKGDVTITD